MFCCEATQNYFEVYNDPNSQEWLDFFVQAKQLLSQGLNKVVDIP